MIPLLPLLILAKKHKTTTSESSIHSLNPQTSSSNAPLPSSFVTPNDTFENGSFIDPIGVNTNLNVFANISNPKLALPNRSSKLFEALFPKLYHSWQLSNYEFNADFQEAIENRLNQRYANLNASLGCTELPFCFINTMKLNNLDIEIVGNALFALNQDESLKRAWPRYANAINYILEVYGNGGTANYPDDSVYYNVNATNWQNEVIGLQHYFINTRIQPPFDAILLAIDLLDSNDRIDAIKNLNIMDTLNKPTITNLKNFTQWHEYKYAAIVIPGEGPDNLETELSPESKLRARLAMQMLADDPKLSKLVVTTGGYVHPSHTTHNEGLNLRNWLINEYNISSEMILAEPRARHTTTNLRNAARLMLPFNYPSNMKLLIVTDYMQREYIKSQQFADRAVSQLGYSLGTIGEDYLYGVEYTPSFNVSFVDPMDPLDP